MMDNIITKIIVAAIFIGYTGYTTYKSVKLYVDFKKKFAEFSSAHKDFELYKDGTYFTYGSAVLSFFSLVMVYISYAYPANNEQVFYTCLAYLCIAVIFVGLAFETYVRKRAYFIEGAMFYVDKIQRFKMMMKFEEKGILIKNIRILMASGETIGVSRKLANEILHRKEVIKQKKKEHKK